MAEFGGTEASARIAYRRFVEQGLHGPLEDPLANAYTNVLSGSDSFVERYRHLVDDPAGDPCQPRRRVTLHDVSTAVVTTFEVVPDSLSVSGRHGNAPRDAAIWLARELTNCSLDDVAETFGGVTRSAVTDAVRRCERRMSASQSYRDLCNAARRLAVAGENAAHPTTGCCFDSSGKKAWKAVFSAELNVSH